MNNIGTCNIQRIIYNLNGNYFLTGALRDCLKRVYVYLNDVKVYEC